MALTASLLILNQVAIRIAAERFLVELSALPSIEQWSRAYDRYWIDAGYPSGFCDLSIEEVERRYVRLAQVSSSVFCFAIDAVTSELYINPIPQNGGSSANFPQRAVPDDRIQSCHQFWKSLKPIIQHDYLLIKMSTLFWLAYDTGSLNNGRYINPWVREQGNHVLRPVLLFSGGVSKAHTIPIPEFSVLSTMKRRE